MYRFTIEEARKLGDQVGAQWSKYDVDQFRMGLEVELEHGSKHPETDVTHDDPVLTAKIALAHLSEFPDYYTRLRNMEAEAERFYNEHRPNSQPGGGGANHEPSARHECWID
jgi:hypothetical protein